MSDEILALKAQLAAVMLERDTLRLGTVVTVEAPASFEGDAFALSERTPLRQIFASDSGTPCIGKRLLVAGWTRTLRQQGGGNLAFVELSDGTCMQSLQVVCTRDACSAGFEDLVQKVATGASVAFIGTVVASPAKGQAIELQATEVLVLGSVPEHYPLAKKKHSLEFLRELLHLRPRTHLFGAMARVRNALAFATHDFFHKRGYVYCNTPLITASDCEGAGEMFQVTTLLQGAQDNVGAIKQLPDGKADYALDFFKKPVFLSVSGQLNAETYACALSSTYTFGPTFRAERSKTTRHLAEFWMIEPEIAFADLNEDMDVAEAYIKHALRYVLATCADDLVFFEAKEIELQSDRDAKTPKAEDATTSARAADRDRSAWTSIRLRDRLLNTVESPFERLTYTRAIEILQEAVTRDGVQFEETPRWGMDLPSEMERYLAETVFRKPIILTNYPKEIKAFYMRANDDGKTVAAMDILVPGIGELVGGSQREERYEHLLERMHAAKIDPKEYAFYLDLRKYGTVPHAGFGLGFERLVRYATGLDNIKDTCMFPRAWGSPVDA